MRILLLVASLLSALWANPTLAQTPPNLPVSVPYASALRATDGWALYQTSGVNRAAIALGNVTPGDGQGGTYAWIAGACSSDDGITQLAAPLSPTGSAACWKLLTTSQNGNTSGNASPGTGLVGEIISSSLSNMSGATTGSAINVTGSPFTLTAGHWDCHFYATLALSGGTNTLLAVGLSSVSTTLPTAAYGYNGNTLASTGTTTQQMQGWAFFDSATSTSVYMVVQGNGSGTFNITAPFARCRRAW